MRVSLLKISMTWPRVIIFRLYICTVFVYLTTALLRPAVAQNIPYNVVLAPLSLAATDTNALFPLTYRNGHGIPSVIDSTDGSNIIAGDTGSGIISHIWGTIGDPDSTTFVCIWVDGSLIRSGTFRSIFEQPNGIFAPPFDSISSGGFFCDVQLPYQRNFRITYKSPGNNLFYAIAWRRLPSAEVGFSAANPSQELIDLQNKAGQITEGRAWGDNWRLQLDTAITIGPASSSTIWDVHGSHIIRNLSIKPSAWSDSWDSLWLQIFWDGSDSASVSAPLADFFGQGAGFVNINSLPISSSQTDGFHIYFPMPFGKRARIVCINRSSQPIGIVSGIALQDTSIDIHTTGYFHGVFSETSPTRYGVYHPVLHWKGAGRLVGLNMSIPGNQYSCALEGDPAFTIDSNPALSFRYTGTEDYFDGGWYFSDGEFSHPFAGCTQKWYSFYRFHILDAIDFRKSIDFIFQHGNNNDVHCDYRTVAYFYSGWQPCWVDRDSVVLGDSFVFHASSYSALQSLRVSLGSNVIGDVQCDSEGKIVTAIQIPSSIQVGNYNFTVNGVSSGTTMHLLNGPVVRVYCDSSNLSIFPSDSLSLTVWGFTNSQASSFYIGDVQTPLLSWRTGSKGEVHATVLIPNLSAGTYALSIKTSGNEIVSPDTVHITSRIWKEAEDLHIENTFGGTVSPMNLCPWWNARWSKQAIVQFSPDTIGGYFELNFSLPDSSVYTLALHGTYGHNYGKYDISIDGMHLLDMDGYRVADDPPVPDVQGTAKILLNSGYHIIRLTYLGMDNGASGNLLWLDAIELNPQESSNVFQGNAFLSSSVKIYPNPLSGLSSTTIAVTLSNEKYRFFSGDISIRLYDVIGRPCKTALTGKMLNGEFHSIISANGLLSGTYFVSTMISADNGQTLEPPIVSLVIE